jgi:hypothetical protein
MIDVTLDGVRYNLSTEEIFIGDDVYNPLSGCIMGIDEEDDLDYVNETYYKIEVIPMPPIPRPKFKPVKPKFFKY